MVYKLFGLNGISFITGCGLVCSPPSDKKGIRRRRLAGELVPLRLAFEACVAEKESKG